MSARKANVSRRRMSAPDTPPWTDRLRREMAGGPKAQAITQGLASAIERGELALGERLPPQRVLAQALGVDLTTVTRAYDSARELGLLAGQAGRGTFVRGA